MNDAEEAQRREVALFRYRLIADLAHQPPGAAGIGEQLRAKAAQTYDIPGTPRTSVAAETLRDWLHAYRLGGFDALYSSLRRDPPFKRTKEPVARRASLPDFPVIDELQQIGMTDLVIGPLLSHPRGLVQSVDDDVLLYGFELVRSRQGACAKALTVVASQSVRVSDDPGLHDLHHEVDGSAGSERQVPFIARMQVFVRRAVADSCFRIHQQHCYFVRPGGNGIAESLIRRITAAARDKAPAP